MKSLEEDDKAKKSRRGASKSKGAKQESEGNKEATREVEHQFKEPEKGIFSSFIFGFNPSIANYVPQAKKHELLTILGSRKLNKQLNR